MNTERFTAPKKCACGKEHRSDIKYIFIENNAVSHLCDMCRGYNNILIVADLNTYAAAGEKSERYLSGKNITRQIFNPDGLLIPNEESIAEIEKRLGETELIIGIGSGVISDLCKYVSHFHKIPYYIVATAPSMDGYASSGAAMILGGMKKTVSAKMPDGFIGDTAILKDAPLEMIKAGYGDILGKYSSLNDWKLAHEILGEYFCDYIYSLTYEMLEEVLPLAKRLLAREESAVKALTEALIGVGIAIAYAGNSRPASGSEHHLSHFFEITGLLCQKPYLPHGIDVAFSTLLTSRIREELCATPFDKELFTMEQEKYRSEMKRVYSKVSDSCIALQKKTGYYTDRSPIYKTKEGILKAILEECPTPAEIEKYLSEIELNTAQFYSIYSEKTIADALLYAKDLKDRFTVLWMYYDLIGERK